LNSATRCTSSGVSNVVLIKTENYELNALYVAHNDSVQLLKWSTSTSSLWLVVEISVDINPSDIPFWCIKVKDCADFVECIYTLL
jgi:WD40 repeat protein